MAIKNNNEEKMKKLSTENICDVSGGEIVQTKSGAFKIANSIGENIFTDGRTFSKFDDAVRIARALGESTNPMTRDQRRTVKPRPVSNYWDAFPYTDSDFGITDESYFPN